MEPLFLAVHSSNPGFNFSKIDLITDRNNLRKLLNFVTGNPKSFRIEVERVGRTTIFTRNEEKVSDEIPEGEFRGFGHQFEENYTEWPPGTTEGSTGHHRIIRYKFGGLHVLVRYAVDVCMPDSTAASPAEDDLSELIGGLALHENDHSQIRISREGNLVPQDSIGEIKTRAAYRKLEMSDVLPQLWFSDTSRLVVGYHHRRGQFDDVKELEMDSELEAWEEDNARDLQKLVELLGKISDAAKGAKNGKCLIIYRGDSSLDIVEPLTEKYRLPEYIRKKLEVPKVT